jgi:hypothetical protein
MFSPVGFRFLVEKSGDIILNFRAFGKRVAKMFNLSA